MNHIMMEFDAVIKKPDGVNGAYVQIPYDVESEYGSRRVKVKAYFDGHLYRGSIVRMGGIHVIGMTQVIRGIINKDPGDTVHVRIEKDMDERALELPENFTKLLDAEPEAKDFYETLSYTHKKEYAVFLTQAKKEETKQARMSKALERLREKKNLR